MKANLKKIQTFLDLHHVLSLATTDGENLSVCNLFYVYDKNSFSFIVASSEDTTHIQNILKQNMVAGSVVLETKTIGKIQGLQFSGEFLDLDDAKMKKLYFKEFPYALVMNPNLWQIRINDFKLTDNRLGFGKKIIWKRVI